MLRLDNSVDVSHNRHMTNGPFRVVVGDDDRHPQIFDDIAEAEKAATELSLNGWLHQAQVRRNSGQINRWYIWGELDGYLDGDEKWQHVVKRGD